MKERVQQRNESMLAYFHAEVRLCGEVSMDFCNTREQVLNGLRSRYPCRMLIGRVTKDSLSMTSKSSRGSKKNAMNVLDQGVRDSYRDEERNREKVQRGLHLKRKLDNSERLRTVDRQSHMKRGNQNARTALNSAPSHAIV